MKLAWLVIGVALAGCSSTGQAQSDGDAGPHGSGDGDAGPPTIPIPPPPGRACGTELRFDPTLPIAGSTTPIRITAVTPNAPSASYLWSIALDTTTIAFTYVGGDNAAIEFVANLPGVYRISVDVMLDSSTCLLTERTLNVLSPRATLAHVRVRVVPPPGVEAPPLEQALTVDSGADTDLGAVVVKRGIPVTFQVFGAAGGVPAYLRFSPNGARDAVVEAFADSTGRVTTTLAEDRYSVLVVPSLGLGGVPRRITEWQAIAPSNLFVADGSTITGTVTDPANAALVGATVQLSIDGVPSTVATTDVAGAFELRAVTGGREVTVTVTPPATSGLPRLSARSMFDLDQPVKIRYAANLGRRSLAGLKVQRAGAALGGAKLMVVGSLAAIGTVTAGASVTATGEVRIAVTADGAGTLPAALVPAARLSAVVTVAPGELAVAPLDTTTSRPATLDAPAPQVIATGARDADGAALPRAVLDLVPSGALAMAAASPIHVVADRNGAFSAVLAAGGHYDLRFVDPAGRAGPLVVADRVATTIDRDGYALPRVVTVRGALLLGGIQPLANASIQILCEICTGIDRAKPIAEAVSDETGRFTLAVTDPGTM